jgi:hypothetical protein
MMRKSISSSIGIGGRLLLSLQKNKRLHGYGTMVKDKHLERIKAIKRVSRIESGVGGKAGIYSDKKERRARRMNTQDWLEEAEEDEEFLEKDDHKLFETNLDSTRTMVICYLCGNPTHGDTAHRHQDKWIGECCWDERLRTTE